MTALDGSTCPTCARCAVPLEDPCLGCGRHTATRTFDNAGDVLAWTRNAAGEPVALVGLEDGARVLARVEGPSPPQVGQQVTVRRTDDSFIAQPRGA